jgi:hypothetical protein
MIVFRRRVGENAMIVGGANAARYGMLAAVLSSLSLNSDPGATQFISSRSGLVEPGGSQTRSRNCRIRKCAKGVRFGGIGVSESGITISSLHERQRTQELR